MRFSYSHHIWLIFWFVALLLAAALFIFRAQPAAGTPGEIRTARISVSSAGAEGNRGSSYPAVAAIADNQGEMHYFAAFSSDAANLVGDDGNDDTDVFVRDLQTNQTRQVSLTAAGQEANGDSWDPALAVRLDPQGQPCLIVAYASAATNIVPGDTNQVTDIFVRDECDGTTILGSRDRDGNQFNQLSLQPALSADGLRLAFSSMAGNLENPDNGVSDVFVYNLLSNEIRRISDLPSLAEELGPSPIVKGSWHPALSADGRFIAYEGLHPEWLGGVIDARHSIQVLVYDWETGATEAASVGPFAQEEGGFVDEPGWEDSLKPSIASSTSSDGQPCYIVAFESLADWGDRQTGNNVRDVYVRNQCTRTTGRIALHHTSGDAFSNNSTAPSISAVSRLGHDYSYFVAYQSWAVANQLNNAHDSQFLHEEVGGEFLDSDIFIYFTGSGQANAFTEIASIDNNEPPNAGGNGQPFRGDSLAPAVSPDGCYVVFKSRATNLELANPTPIADTNFEVDIFSHFRCHP